MTEDNSSDMSNRVANEETKYDEDVGTHSAKPNQTGRYLYDLL